MVVGLVSKNTLGLLRAFLLRTTSLLFLHPVLYSTKHVSFASLANQTLLASRFVQLLVKPLWHDAYSLGKNPADQIWANLAGRAPQYQYVPVI